jgi:release factor glutamine methyltransferase
MIARTNLLSDVLSAVSERLSARYESREAESIARMLVLERFGVTRVMIALNPRMLLSESQIVQIHKDLQQLETGIPVQYVLGYAYFMNLKVKVTPGVLIPRPETEELVMLAAKSLIGNNTPHILDIGTGSGAIALAMKYLHPSATVCATDVSEIALNTAGENANLLNLDISFKHHNILDGTWPFEHQADLILSNPPYIPRSEYPMMDDHVRNFEPDEALFVENNDPLIFYRSIGAVAKRNLSRAGWLFAEVHHLFAEKVATLWKIQKFTNVTISVDINGKQRFVSGQNNK